MTETTMYQMEYDLINANILEFYNRMAGDFSNSLLSKRYKFSLLSEYLDWLEEGKKCTTVRYRSNAIDVPVAFKLPLLRVCSIENKVDCDMLVGTVLITKMTIKYFGSLDDNDARRDGFENESELKCALQKIYTPIYGSIKEYQFVSIYELKLIDKL